MANTILKQHIPIFVSSTYEDLIPYRDQIKEVIVKLEQIVKGMEYFGSSPQNSLSTCLSQVRESKVFILIVAMRYGSIHNEYDLSFSELEYNEAIKNNIPTLVYILNDNYPIPPKFVDTGREAVKLQAFKDKLKKLHTVSFFNSPEDLRNKVNNDLVDTLSKLEEKIKFDIATKFEIKNKNLDRNIIEEFYIRPKKHTGQEGKVKLLVISKPYMLKAEIINSLGLTLGDTIGRRVKILDFETNECISENVLTLSADAKNADWLETVDINDVIEVKVRLNYCVVKEKRKHANGEILSDLTDVVYNIMVLLEKDEHFFNCSNN